MILLCLTWIARAVCIWVLLSLALMAVLWVTAWVDDVVARMSERGHPGDCARCARHVEDLPTHRRLAHGGRVPALEDSPQWTRW